MEPSDRRKLENSWLGLRMRTDPVDLRLCTETDGGWNLKRASVNTIVEECLGFEVEQRKEIGISDWDEEFLSHEQVEYATVDAHCAFLIARDCKVWNFRVNCDLTLTLQLMISFCLLVYFHLHFPSPSVFFFSCINRISSMDEESCDGEEVFIDDDEDEDMTTIVNIN
ncbi:hypothetical protein Ahy_Scaffold6g108068 [Arachis hypogaea]|uniref:3'-5' exonuclease domain-containing protein n=1 Tax=Arachis hypogaea TaxID=3818 RepID=A0A444WPL0_ARAHY|nr:hypothetical protein Ahy_Scaffold6g108068 [Arachis hypogaea]